jgi:hypothetical protein
LNEQNTRLHRPEEEDKKVTAPLASAPKLQGLHDLFKNDFDLLSLDRALTITIEEGSGALTLDVEFRILSNFEANSDFIAVYVPRTTDPIPVCRYFADAYRHIYDDLKASLLASARNPGDLNAVDTKDLVFSGRIYIYHENEINLEQLGVLSAWYRARKLDVQFRGPAYQQARFVQQLATPNKT